MKIEIRKFADTVEFEATHEGKSGPAHCARISYIPQAAFLSSRSDPLEIKVLEAKKYGAQLFEHLARSFPEFF